MPKNYYEVIKNDKEGKSLLKKNYNPQYGISHFIDLPFRLLIIGPSGSMKTNTVIDLLNCTNNTWTKIIVCCKSKEEPLYQFMELKIPITFFEGIENVPKIEDLDLDEKDQTIIIFDDLVAEKNQKPMLDYFLRGRKFGISMVYIAQTYYGIPKFIRCNSTHFLFKSLASVNDLRMVFREHSFSRDLEGLLTLYQFANSEKTSFFLIDCNNGKYFKNWMTKLN